MNEFLDCVVAGHICLDIAPDIHTRATRVSDVLRPGKLLEVGKAILSTGGPVSNTGLPLRRLGVNVSLMGKCGDDLFGRALLELLRAEAPGAETAMQVTPGEETSYSVVINVPGLDRMFLHCPGANDTFVADDVDFDAVTKARIFHFGYPPLMAKMYADGAAETAAVLERARAAGTTTSLDMVYPDPASASGQVDWPAALQRCLPHVDVFTPSVEELTFMLRRETFDALNERAGHGDMLSEIDAELLSDLGRRCLDAGAGVVLIKCGHFGLYLRTAGRDRLEQFGRCRLDDLDAWCDRELFAPSYHVDPIISATGAGDCAIAGFLTSLLRGVGPIDAARNACAVGAQNVQAADSISGVQSWEATLRQVAANPPLNDVTFPMPEWNWCDAERVYAGPGDGGKA